MAKNSVAEQVERALVAGVGEMVIVGVDLDTSEEAIEIACLYEGVYAAVGVHPNESEDLPIEAIRDLAAHPKVVAIGETGIDLYRDRVSIDKQETAFRAQIALAKETGKALIVHGRDAHPEVKRILKSEGPPDRFVMHCFLGTPDDGRDYIELGAYLSLAGPVTFTNAPELRDAVSELPLESMVVETDSPFLSPHPFRGKPNEPARVALVGEAIAHIKRVDASVVAETTTANARHLFGIEP
ncbi:MAG: hydrolase TatD [Acidobacteria bacterium]|nr:MAG: hydrolase TatD [Acidobacteriota bacterium]